MNQRWQFSVEPAADACCPGKPRQMWEATKRHGCSPAPNGLVLVQEFLNTKANARCGPDLLGDRAHARSWAAQAVRAWSAMRETNISVPTLTEHDAAKLRELRDTIDRLLSRLPPELDRHLVATVELALDDNGHIIAMATGHGWRWFASAIWSEILLSQHTGTWERLRQCRNPACRSTFYDRSWDKREVWHTARTCGPLNNADRVNLTPGNPHQPDENPCPPAYLDTSRR
jgi:predicted RNA-binding Zn ribbon-like protein